MEFTGPMRIYFVRHAVAPLVWCVSTDAWELSVKSVSILAESATCYRPKPTPDDEDGIPSAWITTDGMLSVDEYGNATIRPRIPEPHAAPPSWPPGLCPHLRYPARCVDCGADPLHAVVTAPSLAELDRASQALAADIAKRVNDPSPMQRFFERAKPAPASARGLFADETDVLLVDKQASQLTGVPRGTLRAWRARGVGPPFVRLGARTPRYPRSLLIAWIESRTEGGP